jgi:hypothetical protein
MIKDHSEVTATLPRDFDKASQLAREKKYLAAEAAFVEIAKKAVMAANACRDRHNEVQDRGVATGA